eukprot:TRINITY_DN2722_c1_g3_i1.p1 TRINITY_DN2722_c1_g3~~TRINITY_DN2722_c1_g3_i1.p1  ORF type:complete len:267 (-),score=23.51 TRINITY_DN2722_c1_g3_i1:271-1071(-)
MSFRRPQLLRQLDATSPAGVSASHGHGACRQRGSLSVPNLSCENNVCSDVSSRPPKVVVGDHGEDALDAELRLRGLVGRGDGSQKMSLSRDDNGVGDGVPVRGSELAGVKRRLPAECIKTSGAYHDPRSGSQNLGNHIGTRSSVRQSKLFRMYESGNATKALLGQDGLQWSLDKKEGAYVGRVYDAFDGDVGQRRNAVSESRRSTVGELVGRIPGNAEATGRGGRCGGDGSCCPSLLTGSSGCHQRQPTSSRWSTSNGAYGSAMQR